MKRVHVYLLAVLLVVISVVVAHSVQANTATLFSIEGFVETLISKGIISENRAASARDMLSAILRIEKVNEIEALNADKVSIQVSQLIEYANLEFTEDERVQGMLLMVKNESLEDVTLEAKRGCQVVYRIRNEDGVLLYSSEESEVCQTDESVTFILRTEKTRLFRVNHESVDYPLTVGTYTFELEYPGYGGGERVVTISN